MDIQENILKFWRDIEIFNMPDLPDDIGTLSPNDPLPWTLAKEPLEDAKRRYILFFGKQSKPHIVNLIEEFTEDSEEKPDWVEKVSGDTCMAVLILEEDGQLVEDGAYLQASYIHGLTCLKAKQSMDTITVKLEEVQEEFQERYKFMPFTEELNEPINGRLPITWKDLHSEIAVLNENSVDELKCNQTIYCKSITISKKIKTADTAFLNSFYLEDLNGLIKDRKNWNRGINEYLKLDISETKRMDMLKDPKAFFDSISPDEMPAGKWPSSPDYAAYSAQLGAMSTALEELKEGGIIGINGPPGTGKTTLLNDIISEVVVERAKRFIDANNTIMFMPPKTLVRESGKMTYYPVKENIFEDAGIVVASNNNTAVENITKELPARKNIDKCFKEADYFSEQSQELIEGESWGAIAAALGNSENRNQFKSGFWYGKDNKIGFDGYLLALYRNEENKDHTLSYIEKFAEAKKEFLKIYLEFEEFRAKAILFHKQLYSHMENIRRRGVLELEQKQLKENVIRLSVSLKKEKQVYRQFIETRKVHLENINVWERSKPGLFFFHKLFKTKTFKKWNGPYMEYLAAFHTINEKISTNQKKQKEIQDQLNENQQSELKLRTKLDSIIAHIEKYNRKREELHNKYGIAYENIPDEKLYHSYENSKETFHKVNPWSSVKLNTLRSQIFIKSLEIHKYAVLCNARQFRANMYLLFEMMDGKAKVDVAIAETAWKTLFFLIPVISSSLASVSRLFRHLKADSIGYLLLDEAGQATPQSAAGMIFRSKRSIIIGDPLQIEPVLTTPHKLIQILNQPYKLPYTWSPLHTSAQQLADRISVKGTLMHVGDEEGIWTGFPLRTHRRCQEPMFSLANTIAYDHQMVMATPESDFDCKLGASQWFNVNGKTVEDRHVIREEIDLLKEKLDILGKDQEVFVISPFKSVANRCKIELLKNYPKARCGTIHTFQGKESDIVFLILGSDPVKPGARTWASQKPNMLNVALTRAKERFYVIGNRTLWQGCSYFDLIAWTLK